MTGSKSKAKAKARIKSNEALPTIPDKTYFTIGEVGDLCELPPHVLRYWEQEFSELKPLKRRNRRYYQIQDVKLVRRIRELLYCVGYTIDGARTQLSREYSQQKKVKQAPIAVLSTQGGKQSPRLTQLPELMTSLEKVLKILEDQPKG